MKSCERGRRFGASVVTSPPLHAPSLHHGSGSRCERGKRAGVAHLREVPRAAGARASCAAAAHALRAVCARLLRVAHARDCAPQAVHQIAGLRGLFPDDAFKRRDIAGLPNVMELKARSVTPPRCTTSCRTRPPPAPPSLICSLAGGTLAGDAPGVRLGRPRCVPRALRRLHASFCRCFSSGSRPTTARPSPSSACRATGCL